MDPGSWTARHELFAYFHGAGCLAMWASRALQREKGIPSIPSLPLSDRLAPRGSVSQARGNKGGTRVERGRAQGGMETTWEYWACDVTTSNANVKRLRAGLEPAPEKTPHSILRTVQAILAPANLTGYHRVAPSTVLATHPINESAVQEPRIAEVGSETRSREE